MDFVFQIPVIGVVFQLAGYLVDVIPGLGPSIVRAACPIALGALCGLMCERSGIVNIGIEGLMLLAAFFAFLTAGFVAQAMPQEPSGVVFGVTPALALGLLVGVAAAVVVSGLHAWLSISVRADQIISGTIIIIFAAGLTAYLNRLLISPIPGFGAGTFTPWLPPDWLTGLPLVGWVFNALLRQGPIAMAVLPFVLIIQVLLFRSRWGLRTRAVGEHPRAADTLGVDVIRLRYRNVILAGVFAGLAGAYLSIEASSTFQPDMTAGRGFIALAAVIFGRWTPIGAYGAALLFAVFDAIGIAVSIRPPAGAYQALGDLVALVPENFYSALPYVMTIVILAGVVGRSIPPAAVGQPYVKEGKT
jgi:general nucleoside transport system permease protein